MAEAATEATSKARTSKPASSAFEMPKFEMPKFEIPKVEMPAAFREFAERGVAQCKDTYEKMKAAAEEATDVLETTYSTATRGASDYGMKVIETARINTNSAFDFANELIAAKTLSEVIELSSAHARKQFEALTEPEGRVGAGQQEVVHLDLHPQTEVAVDEGRDRLRQASGEQRREPPAEHGEGRGDPHEVPPDESGDGEDRSEEKIFATDGHR